MGLKDGGLRSGGLRNVSKVKAAPDSGILRYEFEQDLTDSWNNNDGSGTGGISYTTTAKYGNYALSTDGTDDFVDTNLQSFSPPFSIAVWVYPITSADGTYFWGNYAGGSDDIYCEDDGGSPYVRIDNVGTITGGSLSTGAWQLITTTVGSSEAEVYLDKTSIGSETGSANATYDSGNTLKISQLGDGSGYAESYYDNFDIYDKVLSSSEVSNLYDTGDISG